MIETRDVVIIIGSGPGGIHSPRAGCTGAPRPAQLSPLPFGSGIIVDESLTTTTGCRTKRSERHQRRA